MLPQETTKLPLPKLDIAYGVKQSKHCVEKDKQTKKQTNKKNPNPTHTTHKKKKSSRTPPPLRLLALTLHLLLHTGYPHLEENKEQMLGD